MRLITVCCSMEIVSIWNLFLFRHFSISLDIVRVRRRETIFLFAIDCGERERERAKNKGFVIQGIRTNGGLDHARIKDSTQTLLHVRWTSSKSIYRAIPFGNDSRVSFGKSVRAIRMFRIVLTQLQLRLRRDWSFAMGRANGKRERERERKQSSG